MPAINFSNYLAQSPCRCTESLCYDFKGQLKSMSLIRNGLGIANDLICFQKSTHERMERAQELLGDMKTTLNVFNVPRSLPKVYSKCGRSFRKWRHLGSRVQRGKDLDSKFLLKVHIATCSAARMILYVTGKAFFKPLKLANRYCEFGGSIKKIAKSWKTLTLIKSGLKIGSLSGQLLLGTKQPIKTAINLILVIGKLFLNLFKMCKIHIHMSIPIIITVSKSIFDIYKICAKSA